MAEKNGNTRFLLVTSRASFDLKGIFYPFLLAFQETTRMNHGNGNHFNYFIIFWNFSFKKAFSDSFFKAIGVCEGWWVVKGWKWREIQISVSVLYGCSDYVQLIKAKYLAFFRISSKGQKILVVDNSFCNYHDLFSFL